MVHIVLPVDFGENADKLVQSAINFAKEINGKIYLIHVASTDVGFVVGEMGFQYFPDLESNEMRQELIQLNEIERQIISQNVDCEHLLKQGIAGETILDYAKQKNADYIVMGSHGRSGIYDVFVGSLTKELTKKSPIPVLVIPIH